jgi:hypothetical protein
MLYVNGNSSEYQPDSIFKKWGLYLEDKNHLFSSLVNMIGTDKNIVDVEWGSWMIYSMAYNDPFVVASKGPGLKFYTLYFLHSNRLASNSIVHSTVTYLTETIL